MAALIISAVTASLEGKNMTYLRATCAYGAWFTAVCAVTYASLPLWAATWLLVGLVVMTKPVR